MAPSEINIVQPDVTLRLDVDGVIQEASASHTVSHEAVDEWVGRAWADLIEEQAGSDKVSRLLDEARASGVAGFRQFTQRFPSGLELPMEYTAVRLGEDMGLVAIGKNLQAVAELQTRLIAAQRAMEQDYWKLRHIETRYRMLFDASSDAVLLVGTADLRTIEANPAAIRALGIAGSGRDFLHEILDKERAAVEAMLQRVREQGKAPAMLVHLGRERTPWLIRASLMTSEGGADFLIQLSPAGAVPDAPADDVPPPLIPLLDRLPDGVVIANDQGQVVQANRSFQQMTQRPTEDSIVGESLTRWLNRPGMDFSVLIANLREYQTIGHFPTMVQGDLGAEREVEISAALSDAAEQGHAILFIRDVGRRLPESSSQAQVGTTLADLTRQIGKASLRDLVGETVGAVERHFIEQALYLTSGNRTATAQLLGLSRQSLYLKLNRYGLGGKGDDPGDT